MGLCASQARLLMLTARRSDLEYQAQQISQARMVLAQNQEAVARKYSDALSNKKLQIRTDDGTVNLTPQTLFEAGYGFKYNGQSYTEYDDATKEAIKEMFGSSTGEVGADNNVFQRYLMEGRIVLLERSKTQNEEDEMVSFDETSVAGTNNIYEVYYTEDDAAAKAEYDASMSALQRKDKQMELDADRIETEHNAIQTEIESVEGVIKKNIESSFKIFADS